MEWDLCVITDRTLAHGRPHEQIIASALAGGCKVVQLRDKDMNTRELLATGERLQNMIRAAGGVFIVNDRVDVAWALDADGVHLGQEDMPLCYARSLLGKRKIIGVSVSCINEAIEAEERGADYLGVGSIFPTITKTGTEVVGLSTLAEIRRSVKIPIVAIGGINPGNIGSVIKSGADGVAVISAVVGAPDVAVATRELLAKVKEARRL